MRIGTGYTKDSVQYIDLWCINVFPSKGLYSISYEFKASYGDFMTEIKNFQKRRAAMRYSNKFYFVVPEDLVEKVREKIPYDCGLIKITEKKGAKKVIRAPYRDRPYPTWLLLCSLARRVDKLLKKYDGLTRIEEDYEPLKARKELTAALKSVLKHHPHNWNDETPAGKAWRKARDVYGKYSGEWSL